jgi:hypothetical protein
MHTHLYAQTGHYATPKEMAALVIVIAAMVIYTIIAKAARA